MATTNDDSVKNLPSWMTYRGGVFHVTTLSHLIIPSLTNKQYNHWLFPRHAYGKKFAKTYLRASNLFLFCCYKCSQNLMNSHKQQSAQAA